MLPTMNDENQPAPEESDVIPARAERGERRVEESTPEATPPRSAEATMATGGQPQAALDFGGLPGGEGSRHTQGVERTEMAGAEAPARGEAPVGELLNRPADETPKIIPLAEVPAGAAAGSKRTPLPEERNNGDATGFDANRQPTETHDGEVKPMPTRQTWQGEPAEGPGTLEAWHRLQAWHDSWRHQAARSEQMFDTLTEALQTAANIQRTQQAKLEELAEQLRRLRAQAGNVAFNRQ